MNDHLVDEFEKQVELILEGWFFVTEEGEWVAKSFPYDVYKRDLAAITAAHKQALNQKLDELEAADRSVREAKPDGEYENGYDHGWDDRDKQLQQVISNLRVK